MNADAQRENGWKDVEKGESKKHVHFCWWQPIQLLAPAASSSPLPTPGATNRSFSICFICHIIFHHSFFFFFFFSLGFRPFSSVSLSFVFACKCAPSASLSIYLNLWGWRGHRLPCASSSMVGHFPSQSALICPLTSKYIKAYRCANIHFHRCFANSLLKYT